MSASNFLTVLVLISIFIGSFGYLYIIPGELGKSKDHDGHCYYEDKKLLLKIDESVKRDCEEISCYDDYSIRIAGCGTFSIHDPSCKRFERDYTKPYPQCCTAFYCAEPADLHDVKHIVRKLLC
ncbi:uncharacterized protein [Chironomus tepperi]|uniref:uncharacterized protein n=1 Tax=Chironomus tepperi TaxID=113505 RepID=UPI00391F14B9